MTGERAVVFYVSILIVSMIQRLLLRHAPTNRIAAFIRTRRGHKWGVPIAAVLVPAYTIAMMRCAEWYEATSNGWIAMLGGLMFWNAVKFVGLAIANVGCRFRRGSARRAGDQAFCRPGRDHVE